jgi:hypothetical protein
MNWLILKDPSGCFENRPVGEGGQDTEAGATIQASSNGTFIHTNSYTNTHTHTHTPLGIYFEVRTDDIVRSIFVLFCFALGGTGV